MSDPLLRELDHYVVLEPQVGERTLTAAETLDWLIERLAALPEPPSDLVALPDNRPGPNGCSTPPANWSWSPALPCSGLPCVWSRLAVSAL